MNKCFKCKANLTSSQKFICEGCLQDAMDNGKKVVKSLAPLVAIIGSIIATKKIHKKK